jgi:tetratricopeptide (TPR) repeat protein
MASGESDAGKPRSAIAGDTNIAQSISGGTFFGPVFQGRDISISIASPDVAVNTLPRDISTFVGRAQELAHLTSALLEAKSNLIVISGMAGSGKSSLAIHAAHSAAEFYPDGQIWASVASDQDSEHSPNELLETLLVGLGVPPGSIPTDLETRSALYRSLLHRRRVLIVLDNVTDSRQVTPLLPPASSSAVIITSRSRLISLEGAIQIGLDVLTPNESVEFLQVIAGPEAATDPALFQIAEICGYLPLAIRLAGAYMRARPGLSVGDFADELIAMSKRLDRLGVENRSVRASFQLSYQQLDNRQARAFRLLASFPGGTFTDSAAARMLDTTRQMARVLLAALADSYLLTQEGPRRYRYRDLLREYAYELCEADPPQDKTSALARLREWYLDDVRRSVGLLTSAPLSQDSPLPAGTEELEWLESERANMLAIAADAVSAQANGYVWKLADALYQFYDLRGHWADCQDMHELALASARDAADRTAAERILNNLGVAYREQYRYTEAISCFEESISLSRSGSSRNTSAVALMNLGVVHERLGNELQSVSCLETALSLSRELNIEAVTRQVLGNLGSVYRDISRNDDALEAYEEALRLFRAAGDRRGESMVLVNLATLYEEQGLYEDASNSVSQSLAIARDIFDRVSEGRALRTLGSASAALGATEKAISELEASVGIAERAGDAETAYLACRDLGDIHLARGETAAARIWYLASIRAVEEIGDIRREAEVAEALAALARREDEPELALAHSRRAVALLRESSDRRSLAFALDNAGSTLLKLDRPSEALVSFEEAAAISRDLGDESLELQALTLLATVLKELGEEGDLAAARRRISDIHRAQPN